MPPFIAALLTVIFVGFLFFRESRRAADVSGALWLPVLWMGVTGSRFVSQWIGGDSGGIGEYTESSAIDAVYFAVLMVAGVGVLAHRRVVAGVFLRNNVWLAAFFLYGLLSVLWSDFPVISLRRWIKTLGHPVMALIILTDPDPANAVRTVMKRCAYLLLPCSLLLIKYFPEYGRAFDWYTGKGFNRGVGLTKNGLGLICMVSGVFFFWHLLASRRLRDPRLRRAELVVSLGFLWMVGWLLYLADSKTSLVALLIGVLTIVLLRSGMVSRRSAATAFVVLAVMAIVAEAVLGISDEMLALLGRDPTLTDRTHVWADALALQDNVLLGTGFESFWLGRRIEVLWEKYWWGPSQAHNGYIETYLNLGAIGAVLLFGLLVATFRKITRQLLADFDFACLKLALFFAIVVYNMAEAAFVAVHFAWTVFYIIAIDYPGKAGPVVKISDKKTSQEDMAEGESVPSRAGKRGAFR